MLVGNRERPVCARIMLIEPLTTREMRGTAPAFRRRKIKRTMRRG